MSICSSVLLYACRPTLIVFHLSRKIPPGLYLYNLSFLLIPQVYNTRMKKVENEYTLKTAESDQV